MTMGAGNVSLTTEFAGSRIGKGEGRRRLVVRSVYFIFLLSLVEGPLRKWLIPGLAGPLTLLRDPFIIALYAYSAYTGLIWTRAIGRAWLFLSAATAIFGGAQYVINGHGLTGWVLGVRTYWLYMPLALVVGCAFKSEDIHRILRLTLVAAIPYAALVSLQYRSSPFAGINVGVAGDSSGAIELAGGIIRPFGLFTYTAPNVQYTAYSVAAFLSCFLWSGKERLNRFFLAVAGIATATMSILTGSRAIYFYVAGILAVTVIGLAVTRPSGKSLRGTFGVLLFVLIAGFLFTSVFQDMFVAMGLRFEAASDAEGGIGNRIGYSAFSFLQAFFDSTLAGYGIGAGAPGVSRMLGLPPFFLGEADTQRNVMELGLLFGIAFLLLRWYTASWVIAHSLRLARRGFLQGLPLAGFVSFNIATAQITQSPINAFLPWLTLGLAICLFNESRAKQSLRL